MGQKVNPKGFRLVMRSREADSVWYMEKKGFGANLIEDFQIRKYLKKKPQCQGASAFLIRRKGEKIEVAIRTSRPGLVIGKKGVDIDLLRRDLSRFTGKQVWVDVEEIKRPDLDATLVAEDVAAKLARRMPFRRVVKRAIETTMKAGADGIKIRVSGRLGGAEIARAEIYKEGRTPLHTLRADIDYGTAKSQTTYGVIGVKVWINRGDIAEES